LRGRLTLKLVHSISYLLPLYAVLLSSTDLKRFVAMPFTSVGGPTDGGQALSRARQPADGASVAERRQHTCRTSFVVSKPLARRLGRGGRRPSLNHAAESGTPEVSGRGGPRWRTGRLGGADSCRQSVPIRLSPRRLVSRAAVVPSRAAFSRGQPDGQQGGGRRAPVSLLSAPMIVDRHPDPSRSLTLTTCPGVPRLTDGLATANRACSGGAIRPFRGRGEPTVLLEGSARADLYAGVLTMVSASGWQAGRLASDPTVSSSKPAGQPAAGDASSASFGDGRRRSSLPLMKARFAPESAGPRE
jgi:hypothetical protein